MALEDLKRAIQNLPATPGVYRMLNSKAEVLYVGKARNLRKRVQSYFRSQGLTARVLAMMQSVDSVEVTVTRSDSEALLLENNLIKTLRPRYNVLLRDDKSYPYIFVSERQAFPRLAFHRGARREKGRYFGPFPSAAAVRDSLNLLQKIFLVRQCEDTFFRNRSRPCLQYQIKRCSAPCVGYVSVDDYRRDVGQALMFLEGRSRAMMDDIVKNMEQAAERQDYETAALYRDRIATLRRVQERQYVSGDGGNADALALAAHGDVACIEAVFVRNGLNLGSKSFFPKVSLGIKPDEILAAFLPQYYLGKAIPSRIYLDRAIADKKLLERVFTEQAGRKVSLLTISRGTPRRWVEMAKINAEEALTRLRIDRTTLLQRFEILRETLALEQTPERVECFDVSHTAGEATVAACVVFDQSGAVKSDYRHFNIEGINPGDDYAALHQALERRYRRLKEGGGKLPDLLLIDGGKGQVRAVQSVLEELQIQGVRLVGVAKGRERRPGGEQLFAPGSAMPIVVPPANSPALHLIQQIRDEAHRFAISGHRQRRARARTSSPLEQIAGIGDKKRRILLKSFGGLKGVARAGVEELSHVPGISPLLARRIYDAFHDRGH